MDYDLSAMESRVRHDLRSPIANISMIASTVNDLGDSLGETAISRLRDRVRVELEELDSRLATHNVVLDDGGFRKAADVFLSDSYQKEAADSLLRACNELLGSMGAPNA